MIPNSFKVSRDATSVGHLEYKKFDPMHATHQICDNETSVSSWKPPLFCWGPAISFIGSRFY